jgi:hypothetical protein
MCSAPRLQVMAAVFGPRDVELRSQEQQDRAIIKCEYAMAPFSTGEAEGRLLWSNVEVLIRLSAWKTSPLRGSSSLTSYFYLPPSLSPRLPTFISPLPFISPFVRCSLSLPQSLLLFFSPVIPQSLPFQFPSLFDSCLFVAASFPNFIISFSHLSTNLISPLSFLPYFVLFI